MNVPNFITNFSIIKNSIKINSYRGLNLKNKIVIIDNADPGYDWLFTSQLQDLSLNMEELIHIWRLDVQN